MSFKFIKEILGMPPAPFEWLDDNRCIFSIDAQYYGIYIEELVMDTDPPLTVANVSFGRLTTPTFAHPDELDLSLSGAGKPRLVMSTVGAACIAKHSLQNTDVICLAATDAHSLRRSPIYAVAASEIRQCVPGFGSTTMETLKTQSGSLLTLIVKNSMTDEVKNIVRSKLNLTKIQQ